MNLEKRKTTSSNKTLLYRCINTSIQILSIFLLLFFTSVSHTHSAIEFTISKSSQAGDEITLDILLSGLTSQSCNSEGKCYLQGVIQKNQGGNYFGQTENNSGDWYKYTSSLNVDYIVNNFFYITPQSGSWSGQIKVKNDPSSSFYLGPGEYLLKSRRYSGKSDSHSGESNSITISLSETTPSPTPAPTQNPTNTPSPTKTSTPLPTKTVTPSPKPTTTTTPTTEDEDETSSEIVGFITNENQTQTSKPQVAGVSISNNKTKVIAFIFVYIGLICLGFGIYSLYKKFKLEYNLKNAKN